MKHFASILAAGVALTAFSAAAKDKPVSLQECPPAVQATIQQYSAKGSFEGVELDEKKKSGGPAIYEAKFTLQDGRRVEVHISQQGAVVQLEEKQRKN